MFRIIATMAVAGILMPAGLGVDHQASKPSTIFLVDHTGRGLLVVCPWPLYRRIW